MFVDVVNIFVRAGNGGNGAVSFHREKYVASGGPDGGDGGKGGDIVFVSDPSLTTLVNFRYKRKFTAENGQNGYKGRCTGKSGKNLIIKVPKGTLVKEKESGMIIADISDDSEHTIAFGGKGGFGNHHFANSTRQAPNFSKLGEKGEEFELTLELKLLADVGVIGLPNVGKSTLISVVSKAKPNIADYHFTTLTPVLGVVNMEGKPPFVIADIPGLIEGASEGLGLGHEFLRHVERCRVLVHMVDVSGSEGRDPIEDFEVINKELALFNQDLSKRKMIVVANKCDMATDEQISSFKDYVQSRGYDFFPIMAAIKYGVPLLLNKISEELSKLEPLNICENEVMFMDRRKLAGNRTNFKVVKHGEVFVIEGTDIERVFGSINFDDSESLQHFQKMLNDMGIIKMLSDAGAKNGDTVAICDMEFDFIE